MKAALVLLVDFTTKTTLAFEHRNVDTLTIEVRQIFNRYDCECIPLSENRLGVYQACDYLADISGLKPTPKSPVSHTPLSEPVTPAAEPGPAITKTPSPSLFERLTQQRQFSVCDGDQPFDCNFLSGTNFQTTQQSKESQFETPQSSEMPQVAATPKKRLPEQSLMVFLVA